MKSMKAFKRVWMRTVLIAVYGSCGYLLIVRHYNVRAAVKIEPIGTHITPAALSFVKTLERRPYEIRGVKA